MLKCFPGSHFIFRAKVIVLGCPGDWFAEGGIRVKLDKKWKEAMAWIYLVVAGLFECGWAIGLKYTVGFTKLVPSLLTISAMAISFWLLSLAMKTIPVGTAYAVWTGIGAVGVAILGMFLFGESRDVMRVVCLLLIVSGIVGLKLVSPS
ncbi:quaternary ammonium compound efflux SMR transporter SugE [Microbulbifer epialgicus]|uniref:quaternary ammonium compound efflux SMR transporter SugE n=1 Tax=Microbulbifer epialgicus TaxID=393907 RepID=UPI003FA5D9B4